MAPSYRERTAWFHRARFGLFIHWGLYSLLERGEWVMHHERIPRGEYAKLADRFNPQKFDPDAWAGLAREAGMKYMVMTTRHHDGFCLFDSGVSDFTSTRTAAGRDFIAEYVKACRRARLKVGFYYSLLDWRFPGYFEGPKKNPESFQAMVKQVHDQVRELLSNYGKIDIMWYDGDWLPPYRGLDEEPAKLWQSRKLNAMVRKLQPHIILNNRAGLPGDLDTPEQRVTASRAGRAWESCMTMGDSRGWGYVRNNPNFKPAAQLIQNLVMAAAGEGNYLLNIGPKPDGTVRKEELERLRALGKFMKVAGESVYSSERCPLSGGMLGLTTAKGNTAYLHIFRWPGREACIAGVGNQVRSARLLGSKAKLKVARDDDGRVIIKNLPARPPNPYDSVVALRLDGKPRAIRNWQFRPLK